VKKKKGVLFFVGRKRVTFSRARRDAWYECSNFAPKYRGDSGEGGLNIHPSRIGGVE